MHPLHTTLPDGRHVIISAICEEELSDVYALVQGAALNNDGFGYDEFPTESHFRAEVQQGKNFQICLQDSGKLVAVLFITTSKFYRGQSVADSYILVQPEERRKGIGEFCFRLCVDYCRRLGYQAMYADTFSTNVAMRKIFEKFGFQRVGVLPMGGTLQDGTVVSSQIYYLDLRAPNGSSNVDSEVAEEQKAQNDSPESSTS